MNKRAQSSRRILDARRQLHRIEEWKMADLERRLAGLEAAQMDLIGALNGASGLHGLFIDTMARRLRSLAEEMGRVVQEKAAQALVLAEHAARVRIAERLDQTITQEVEREEERKELLDVVEQYVNRKTTSLP